MKMRIASVAALMVSVVTPGMAVAKEPQMTGMALQQVQSKDFEAPIDVLFPSVVTVLQDAGYRITATDRAGGTLSGIGSAEAKTTYNIWYGFGKKKQVPAVTAFVEERGPNISRARLNFVLSVAKSRNSFSDETPVTDPAVYKDVFEKIEKEVFVRLSMKAAPKPAGQ